MKKNVLKWQEALATTPLCKRKRPGSYACSLHGPESNLGSADDNYDEERAHLSWADRARACRTMSSSASKRGTVGIGGSCARSCDENEDADGEGG
eukprot:6209202-Pleurochrysis_carterae.AAC.3